MGIADKMVKFIETLKSNINKILVCTGKENYPAINLYLKNGYKKNIEIKNGVYITEFEKLL
ncbi:MAG: GNAT family N-acetyltransferase [Clostridium thermopalmarium]|nr:GNAT family N-acetyltransferase [Clostridium thermopalmarium]